MTNAVDAGGRQTAGEFHEQTPYLEWRNSVFNDEVDHPSKEAKSCQACHMPTTDVDGDPIATRIAHNPGGRDFPFLRQRTPFGRHAFLGGNTLMKRILRDNAECPSRVTAKMTISDNRIQEAEAFGSCGPAGGCDRQRSPNCFTCRLKLRDWQ
ncbi:hypothetical protein Q31b_47660 [Novipirellula aureliae]|uniref:Cytochrome c-552/4 domain-containing protein n=1 Tax=Novipirellula aureliae TaxID=2527966 RepID=A0A5C6DJS1_9BACT|nr:hypothetical protein [Novipirellula aureliae]TWU36485.1 hypothetical protein Q31b_47660 [Novipirellula aureliae]